MFSSGNLKPFGFLKLFTYKTDSEITLAWLKGHPSRWKTFVASRVSEISTSIPNAIWHHVSSEETLLILPLGKNFPTNLETVNFGGMTLIELGTQSILG